MANHLGGCDAGGGTGIGKACAARLAAVKPPFPWRRWILWLVLLGALAALGYMAARLLEETGRPQPPS